MVIKIIGQQNNDDLRCGERTAWQAALRSGKPTLSSTAPGRLRLSTYRDGQHGGQNDGQDDGQDDGVDQLGHLVVCLCDVYDMVRHNITS